VGLIGIGRIKRGTVKTNTPVRNGRVLQVMGFDGLKRVEIPEASAGDIVAISGVENLSISDTLCDRECPEALPPLTVDRPTISMFFSVNDSPFAGKEGKYLTSRQIKDRLEKEATYNVALRVEPTDSPDTFKVSGRGELHLSVLLETMRREGFELAISRPEVIYREVDGEIQEPFEELVVDVQSYWNAARK